MNRQVLKIPAALLKEDSEGNYFVDVAGLIKPKKKTRLSDAINKHLLDVGINCREKTYTSRQAALNHFSKLFDPRKYFVEDFGADHCKKYIEFFKLCNIHGYNYFHETKIFFQWCINKNLIERNPFNEFQHRKRQATKPVVITAEESEKFDKQVELEIEKEKSKTVKHKSGKVLPLVNPVNIYNLQLIQLLKDFLLDTGCRRGEALGLNWSDIDFTNKVIIIGSDSFQTKTGNSRVIPMTKKVHQILLEQKQLNRFNSDFVFCSYRGKQFDGSFISKKFKEICRKAGLPENITMHKTRHTFASVLVSRQQSIFTVAKLLGHSSVSTTEKFYANCNVEALRQTISALEGYYG